MMSFKQYKIFLVDDHPLVRESLASLIQQQSDFIVCGEAEDNIGAQRGILTTHPDVAIVDISLKGGSGLELIKIVKHRAPEISIIVLSMHEEGVYAERAIRAGARGYIMKRETSKKVIEAIRHVLSGKIYVSSHMAEILASKLLDGRETDGRNPVEALSDRELEVFDLLGQGIETRRVAEMLDVSMKTVQTHCARIKEKLALANAAELLREAVRWHDQQNQA
jgi:DNA-binding NarL/FixJ family response regulator